MESIDKLRELLSREIGEAEPYFKGVAICDEIEAEIADNYMLRPMDADGVPWHIGEEVDGCEIVAISGYQLYYYDDGSETVEWCIAKNRCHVKPGPLAELLNDHLQEREKIVRKLESGLITLGEAESEERECDELFAKRIRELMKEGGE